MAQAAASGLDAAVAGGAYDRLRALPRLIPIDPRDLARDDAGVRRMVLARLSRALRAERRRGRAGHWTYDLNRHVALLQAIAAEGGRSPRFGSI